MRESSAARAAIGVSINPGASKLKRMRSGTYRAAEATVIARTAPLLAEYARVPK